MTRSTRLPGASWFASSRKRLPGFRSARGRTGGSDRADRSRRAGRSFVAVLAVACAATLSSGVVAALTIDPPGGDGRAQVPAAGTGASGGTGARPGGGGADDAGDVTKVMDDGGAAFRRTVPPDLLAVASRPITAARTREIGKLGRVRDVLVVGGGVVRLQGRKVNTFAVDPAEFRSWTPPGTARRVDLWSALAADRFVLSSATARNLGVRPGLDYTIEARTVPHVTMGGSGSLGLPGVDMLVSRRTGSEIGLVPDIAVMVNAPDADLTTLSTRLRRVLGAGAKVLNLHEGTAPATGGRRPVGYLDLYRQAATTCPGLSWTVLAAIGQIESAHGRNAGRSSAGALGPMQFMPATWQAYGVDGDGDRKADIMNPYDAVPSAAKYLCANGAGRGGDALYTAIFRYNHADWYVRNVLDLAAAYARRYR